jgi:hypothetical protein
MTQNSVFLSARNSDGDEWNAKELQRIVRDIGVGEVLDVVVGD